MREELRAKEQITLTYATGTEAFAIDGVIGKGATCCVYAAHSDEDGSRAVRIKELYPAEAIIVRKGQTLFWEKAEERDAAIMQFEAAARRQMQLASEAATGNSTVHLEGIYDGNGTKYLVMACDHGITFDRDTSRDLGEILQSILALTKAIEPYHNAGLLHLDIKPENFLIIPNTRELVKLFDTDTIISKEDLANAVRPQLSYTQKWAAPEQKQGRTSKICDATDHYAIGAILFERVMGRAVENDDIGIFADWNFDGLLAENVSPVVQRALKEIFHKTLAASVKSRYQTTAELRDILEEAIAVMRRGQPYLVSACPPEETMIGRFQELIEIEQKFHGGMNAIFLHGFGGIGKTTLALSYLHSHRTQYDAVLFLDYRVEASLEGCIQNISICTYTDDELHGTERIKKRLGVLRQICEKEKCLFLIDNFDTDQDELLREVLSIPADFLITTRNDYSDFVGTSTCQIEVNPLPDDVLLSLLEEGCTEALSDAERSAALRMVHAVEGNTLFVSLLACLPSASGRTLEKLSEDMLSQPEAIAVRRDGNRRRMTVEAWMKWVWNASERGEEERQALRNVWVLEGKDLTKKAYRDWAGPESLNAVNQLIDANWIQWRGGELFLHALIGEAVQSQLKPVRSNCAAIAGYMERLLKADICEQQNVSPKQILSIQAKWLNAETEDEEKENLLAETCNTFQTYMLKIDSTGNADADKLCFCCFDERFSPDDYFRPLLAASEGLVREAEHGLGPEMEQYEAVIYETGKAYPNGPSTKEEVFWASWEMRRRRLNRYLSVLRTQIHLNFLCIRMLSAYDTMMTEWGEWYREDTSDSNADENYKEVRKRIEQVADSVAAYDETLNHYGQICLSEEAARFAEKYYFDEQVLLCPKELIRWYWPIIRSWDAVLEDRSLETVISTETGMLHATVFKLMQHSLIHFEAVLSENEDAQDDWGNYRELAYSLIPLMSVCVFRMEESGEDRVQDDSGLRIACGQGWRLRSPEELMQYRIPRFRPPQFAE